MTPWSLYQRQRQHLMAACFLKVLQWKSWELGLRWREHYIRSDNIRNMPAGRNHVCLENHMWRCKICATSMDPRLLPLWIRRLLYWKQLPQTSKERLFFHAFQSLSVFDQAEGMWLCNNKVQAEIWCTCFVLLWLDWKVHARASALTSFAADAFHVILRRLLCFSLWPWCFATFFANRCYPVNRWWACRWEAIVVSCLL